MLSRLAIRIKLSSCWIGGANVHVNNDHSLRLASYRGHVGVVDVLLRAGAGVHVDNEGALHLAIYCKHLRVVVKLVGAGADLRVLDKCWIYLFNCNAPANLLKMNRGKVIELLEAEAVKKELV